MGFKKYKGVQKAAASRVQSAPRPSDRPTIGRHLSRYRFAAYITARVKCNFIQKSFFPTMTPINIRPSPCVVQCTQTARVCMQNFDALRGAVSNEIANTSLRQLSMRRYCLQVETRSELGQTRVGFLWTNPLSPWPHGIALP